MPDGLGGGLGFSAEGDQPVGYMARTRGWYAALGYAVPYRWASFADVPFVRLGRGLRECRVALITTAAPFRAGLGDQGPGAAYNGAAKFFEPYAMPIDPMPDLRISHVAYDRRHTTATDPASYLPIAALRRAEGAGRLTLAQTLFGAPTNRSQRVTIERDGPELLRRCRAEGVDAAVLVANCPVCHQTCALVARALEAGGIATVVMGAAKDIVEHCGVPRLCFSDFPLGNAAGKPHDPASQDATLALALALLDGAPGARTTVQSPQRWAEDPAWKLDYCNAERAGAEELALRRAEFEREKRAARGGA